MKKILSIDGGGIKGIFAASFLTQIEEKCNGRICDYFDMIAGTSTGGIIAAALSVGISANEILKLYMENAKAIFPQNTRFKLFSTKYSNKPLKAAVTKVLGNKKIRNCKTRLLIPAYNLQERKARVFKTPHADDLYFDKNLLLRDIVMATTAAPLYFPPYTMEGGIFIDGGVVANNPSFMAVAEGLTRCGWSKEDIALLSIGGVEGAPRTTGEEHMGIMNALKIQKCFMGASSQYAENLCGLFLKEQSYLRINDEPLPSAKVSLDRADEKTRRKLRNWGRNKAQNEITKIRSIFWQEKKGNFKLYNLD